MQLITALYDGRLWQQTLRLNLNRSAWMFAVEKKQPYRPSVHGPDLLDIVGAGTNGFEPETIHDAGG